MSSSEGNILPVMKLKSYNFTTQKYAYFIYNELNSKIGSCERRDLSKYISKKDYNIRYYFFNDINRIIASLDGKTTNELKDSNASWQIYDYGRLLRGEIKYIVESDSWQILDSEKNVIALRDPRDEQAALKTARQFTIIDANNSENQLFQIIRKTGFQLKINSSEVDPHIAWATVIAIHRKYYL